MKKLLLFLLIGSLFFKVPLIAQEKSTCEQQILALNEYLLSDIQKNKDAKTIFKSIKECAKSGDAEAAYTLGVLYKDGIGTNLNFKKAYKSFEESYDLGSAKAAYSIGYLYFKGFGNVPQNYTKAVDWFIKSNTPMANHWLAKCYYHGYGVEINKDKAVELLKNNAIINSQVLLSQWEHEIENPEESEVNYAKQMKDSLPELLNNNINSVFGSWIGEWQILDWSGKRIERTIPIYLEVIDNGTGLANVKVNLDGRNFSGNVLVEQNELIFPELTINLKNRYTDNPYELSLDYRIASFQYNFTKNEESQALSGTLETNIENWLEPGPPSKLVLHREGTTLSQEVRDALNAQQEYFIKVYPNPFEQDLLLYYTLQEDAQVLAHLFDYYSPQIPLRTLEKKQKKGERQISFDGLNSLKKGLYIVQMVVNGAQHSRIVIKK
jgi:hypothetical protein